MEVTASAPGKVFLLGEYAVALGAPAIVATVERRLGCRIRSEAGAGRLRIRAAGSTFDGPIAGEELVDVPPGCRFVAAAVRVGARAFGLERRDLEVETWTGLDTGPQKLGLGGSAAVVAAVLGGLRRLAGPADPDARTTAALGVAAHRLAQGGGSGADVVAATLGGLLWLADLDATAPPTTVSECLAGVRFAAEPLSLPPGLALEVVATGESVRTGPRIRRFVERAGAGTGAAGAAHPPLRAWIEAAGAASTRFREACRTRDAAEALRALADGRSLLGRLGALTGIRIWTPRLRAACEVLPGEEGFVGKPSGAGGGDCAVALVSTERRAALREAWRAAGLQPLEGEASLTGVSVSGEAGGSMHG